MTLRFELGTAADDPGLRRLLRENPMDGRIRVTLEREPDFFRAAAVESDEHYTAIARDPSRGILAMGSRSVRSAFVNGEPVRLGYLGQLRVDRAARPRLRQLLPGGFELLRQTHREGEAAYDITTIVADNRPARRLLEAGLPGLPRYRPLEEIVTFLLPVRDGPVRARGRIEVAAGSELLLPGILECLERFGRRHQFAPRWVAANLPPPGSTYAALAGGRVAGTLALWDQRAFKQVVVRGYDPWLGRCRPLLNLLHACLPAVGAPLALAHLSPVAIDGDDPEVFEALLAAAVEGARRAGFEYLAIALAARHPLAQVVRRRLRGREYASVLYAVSWDPPPALDGRVPHLEVAVL